MLWLAVGFGFYMMATHAQDVREEHASGELGLGAAAVVWGLMLVAWLILVIAAVSTPWLWLVAGLLLPFMFSWTVATRMCVPLGLWRLAYVFGYCARIRWSASGSGGAVAAAWALCHGRGDGERARERVRRVCMEANRADAGHVLALGLLRADDDREHARRLIASVLDFDYTAWGTANRLASEWLAAEAAERGDWERVVELDDQLGPRSPAFRLMAALAQRITDADYAPNDRVLWWRWWRAPARRRTRPMVRAVIEGWTHEPQPVRRAPEPVTSTAGPFAVAIRTHAAAAMSGGSRVTEADIDRIGAAWDDALSAEFTEEWLLRRAVTLMARDAESVMGEVETTVARSLSELVRAASCDLEGDDIESETAFDAIHLERAYLLGQLAATFDRLRDLADQLGRRPLNIWDEWASARAHYHAVVARGGIGLHHAAFTEAHDSLCHLAVAMWNAEPSLRPLANAMFRWLLDEAILVEDDDAIELQSSNVEAGL